MRYLYSEKQEALYSHLNNSWISFKLFMQHWNINRCFIFPLWNSSGWENALLNAVVVQTTCGCAPTCTDCFVVVFFFKLVARCQSCCVSWAPAPRRATNQTTHWPWPARRPTPWSWGSPRWTSTCWAAPWSARSTASAKTCKRGRKQWRKGDLSCRVTLSVFFRLPPSFRYFPKTKKAAAVLLYNLWSEKDLQSYLKKVSQSSLCAFGRVLFIQFSNRSRLSLVFVRNETGLRWRDFRLQGEKKRGKQKRPGHRWKKSTVRAKGFFLVLFPFVVPQQGMSKSSFVNDVTTAAHRAVQVVDWAGGRIPSAVCRGGTSIQSTFWTLVKVYMLAFTYDTLVRIRVLV